MKLPISHQQIGKESKMKPIKNCKVCSNLMREASRIAVMLKISPLHQKRRRNNLEGDNYEEGKLKLFNSKEVKASQ